MALDAISGSGIGFANYSQTKASSSVNKAQDPAKVSQKAYSSVEAKGLNQEPAARATTDRVELNKNSAVSESAQTQTPAKAYTMTDNPAKTAVQNSVFAKSPAKANVASTSTSDSTSAQKPVESGKAQLPADSMAELIRAATEASDKIDTFNRENNRAGDTKIQDLNNYIKNNSSENINKLVTNNATQNQMAAIMMMR